MKLKIGQKYALNHARFGRATVEVTGIDGEWIHTKIISGTLRGLTEIWEPGDEKTVRESHCTFEPVKTEPEAPAWTPGPLTVEGNSQDGEFYEIVTCDTVQRQGSPVEERLRLATVYSRADAELYAAAPDMAEALAAMLEHEGETVADGIGIEHDGPNLQAAKANARAILARLHGEGGAK